MYSRVIVCGGRDFKDRDFFSSRMNEIAYRLFERTVADEYGNFLYSTTIISGGAKGVDQLAIDWAIVENTGYKEYKADWDKYGKAAGPIRNQQMIDEGKPDLVIAFPGGKGTADMVARAKQAGIEVIEIETFSR
jgi:hypothetical protein